MSGAFAGAGALYVDFSNTGPEDGTSPQPFNTLDEALGQATLGQLISLSAFASHETPTITQAVTLTSNSGTATIGDLSSPFGSGSPYEALKITEIMYNPALGKAEYLELQNTSARTIDISGVYFSLGIVYTFPPSTILTAGQYIVLVRDTDEATFISDYPSVSHAGVYTGALNNGGETIALNDPANNVFLT
ncbi:MAG: lamin tail domain-containing protein, partial [Candidatus Hydrogenedentota bacterium]